MHNQTGEVYALRDNWPGTFVRFKHFPGLGSDNFDLIWKANGNVDFDLTYNGQDGTFDSNAVWNYRNIPREPPEWKKTLERLKQG